MRKRTVELLYCKLTEEEVLEKGKQLAEKELELIDTEAEAKEVAANYKETIKGKTNNDRQAIKGSEHGKRRARSFLRLGVPFTDPRLQGADQTRYR